MRNDVLLHQSDTEREALGDEQYQNGLYVSKVLATVIPITNTPKRKKKYIFGNPLVNVYLH